MYNQYGYYPFDKMNNEAVSRTLESGYDDYCVAIMAEKMGKKEIAETYYKRANIIKICSINLPAKCVVKTHRAIGEHHSTL